MSPEVFAVAIVVVILSIIFHEVAHGYVANWLGDPTARLAGRLTLNPLPHIGVKRNTVFDWLGKTSAVQPV